MGKGMRRFSTKQREQLWDRCCQEDGGQPICPHCEQIVHPTQAWDECHVGAPKALGGIETKVGHRRCNQLDNNLVVTPMVAKVKRVRRRAIGAKVAKHPLPGSRRSKFKILVGGGTAPRLTTRQRHLLFLERRRIK